MSATDAKIEFVRAMEGIADRRAIYVGETHDHYGHHLNLLAVIRELHSREVDFAIGMEFFQRPFQKYLDDYVRGEIGESWREAKTALTSSD